MKTQLTRIRIEAERQGEDICLTRVESLWSDQARTHICSPADWPKNADTPLVWEVFEAIRRCPERDSIQLEGDLASRVRNLKNNAPVWSRTVFGSTTSDSGQIVCRLSEMFESRHGSVQLFPDSISEDCQIELVLPGTEQPRQTIANEDLVELGLSIYQDIDQFLSEPDAEDKRYTEVDGKKSQGIWVRGIDVVCNRIAQKAVRRWSTDGDRDVDARTFGEDLDLDDTNIRSFVATTEHLPDVLCLFDLLDGTEHWASGTNLFSSAMSFMVLSETGQYELEVSMLMMFDLMGRCWKVYVAREDEGSAYVQSLDGSRRQRLTPSRGKVTMETARVCTVARAPQHWNTLSCLIEKSGGCPVGAMNSFGGNPMLGLLAEGRYHAVFQPDQRIVDGDRQPLWDLLPGLHLCWRSGCHVRFSDGSPFDVKQIAQDAIHTGEQICPYIATPHEELIKPLVEWLNPGGEMQPPRKTSKLKLPRS